MLHGRGIELVADALEELLSFVTIVAVHAQLDELVGQQIDVDFVQHRGRKALTPYTDDGVQMVCLGAQRTALRGIEGFHGASLADAHVR